MTPTKFGNVLSWGSDVEESTIEQAAMASRLPFVKGHLALMPDAHIGKGSTIGSVIPTQGAIIPSAIGVDIGCGMIASETSLTSADLPDDLAPLHKLIAQAVPAGVGRGHDAKRWMEPDLVWDQIPQGRRDGTSVFGFTDKQQKKVFNQFGSLGSGNHFVEVCLDERDVVWVVLHAGSRGIGNELAQIHIEGAKGLMKARFIELEDPDLAYLVQGEPSFEAYITDMLWAQDYALANRAAMMDAVLKELWAETGIGRDFDSIEVNRVNCHHNFTVMEHHLGTDVWLTRKGAVRARVGDLAVIPGSMGTSSFIVSGLGNPASYNSCAHGAGRRMSRAKARRELTLESLEAAMGDRAWNGMEGMRAGDGKALVDEHPLAYKSIEAVMEDQKDLVEIVHTLHQVLNFKGV